MILKENKNQEINLATERWVRFFWFMGLILFIASFGFLFYYNQLGFYIQMNHKSHFITGFKASNIQAIQFFVSCFFYDRFLRGGFHMSQIAIIFQFFSLFTATVFLFLRLFNVITNMEPFYTLLTLSALLLLAIAILIAFILWIFSSIKLN